MTTNPERSKAEITSCEKRLLNAFTHKELDILDELIHEEALFVLPDGKTLTKNRVIDNYRGGGIAMSEAISSDPLIHLIGDTATISVNLELNGTSFEKTINARFRYLRVWKLIDGAWKVIAVSGVPL